MSEPLRGVIVTHSAVADSLLRAMREIVGDVSGMVAVSNDSLSAEALAERVATAVGSEPAVVFVDLPGGSCFLAAMRCIRGHPGVAIVAGVNLAMLLDFIYHRDLAPDQAAARAVDVGTRAIRVLSR